MRWSEHQQAMLRAMGLRVWPPTETAGEAADADTVVVEREVHRTEASPMEAAPHVAEPRPEAFHRAPAPVAEPAARAPAPSAAPPRPAVVVAPMPAGASPCAEMGWDALRAAVAGCEACALSQSRTHTVFGVGHEQAHWMIVGEAPGEQEDKQGEPFVGAAGHLLDAMLGAVGRTRTAATPEKQVFIANTLKCRPPRNRNPSPEELAQCASFLHRQIELVQPRVLLAMGRFAIQQLLNSDAPIGRLRGQVHDYRGIPVIVTYHPAYLLRQLTEKAKAWEDLCLAETVYRQRIASATQQA